MKTVTNSLHFTLFYYQARLIWRVNLWIAPLIALLIPVFFYLPSGPELERVYWSLKVSESFAPLLGIVICANLFSQEWESQMAELWLAKSISRTKLLLARALVGCAYTALMVVILLAEQYFTYVQFDWGEMLLVVLPPTIFLSVLGMTIGIMSKNSPVAFLIPLVYWFFEMTTKGRYTGLFFLFPRATYTCLDTVEICFEQGSYLPWALSKWLIVGVSIALVILSIGLFQRIGRALPQVPCHKLGENLLSSGD